MEYCEGRSLDAVVRQLRDRPERGRSSELVLGKIAVGVLGGLDYLHERRIIHRGPSSKPLPPPPQTRSAPRSPLAGSPSLAGPCALVSMQD